MSIADRLHALADRIDTVISTIETEEATKTALVLPFLQALGYDVFNPKEVVPEFTADVGIKRGEKVDYAVFRDGEPIILIECKPAGADLSAYSSQLYRYFNTTRARIAILTDGVRYRFYTDLREPNKMDPEPFMEADLKNLNDRVVAEIAKLSRPEFDLDTVLQAADTLRMRTEVGGRLAAELADPSDHFIRVIADPIHEGRLTQNVVDRYREFLKVAVADFIRDEVDKRLKAALSHSGESRPVEEPDEVEAPPPEDEDEPKRDEIETTMEELAGYYTIKAIVRGDVELSRIIARDTRTYFGILLDDNNRKPICRLWFNRQKKYLGVFDAEKNERRIEVMGTDDLFEHAEAIRDSLRFALSR